MGGLRRSPAPKVLRSAGWALLATYLAMAVIHVTDLAKPGALVGLVSSVATLVLLIVGLLYAYRFELTPRAANGLQALFALIVLANVSLHYVAARDPSVAAMFVFYMVGAGGLLYDRRWLTIALVASYGAWLTSTLTTVPHVNATRDGIALLTACVISFALHHSRMRALVQLEMLREEAQTKRDVAETRLAALSRVEGSFAALVQGHPDGMLLSREGTVRLANDTLGRMLGYGSGDDLVGRRVEELFGTAAPNAEGMREVRLTRPNVGNYVLELRSSEIDWEHGSAMLIAARDSTARHAEAQQHLARTDRLLTVGRLAASAAHEINNPLTYVLGNLEELSEASLSAEQRELVSETLVGARRIKAVVAGLKGFVRPGENQLHYVDLAGVVNHSLRMVEHRLKHVGRVQQKIEARPRVLADEHQLGQVLINLLVNAGDTLASRTDGELTITLNEIDGRAVLCVGDNGEGMKPAVLARAFEPFFTTKPVGQGTGLGLYYCHNAIQSLGGTISVKSDVGKGTTFQIELAIAPPGECSPRTERASDRPSQIPRLRLLVIDDDPLVGRSVARLFSEHAVELTDSAARGLELVAAGEFDAILCDLMMPGIDGVQVCEQLAQAGKQERLVLMTGGVFTPQAQAFLDATSCPVLIKPFTRSQAESALGEVRGRVSLDHLER